ncbi:hypothetical protein AVEN_162287-1 [Araneus ventricosus]|uniref:Uncharacterized protein n=1 Tax=Araneus ventricosus TaxID=182803 RepID=A0A4Y2SA80_ARAVE|nr:hypothetical protein AVEN_141137-1 [Araneus ventricosus]GBN85134.1 hypothetical protein AVEN_162287-1 [Araneus ventricosus]
MVLILFHRKLPIYEYLSEWWIKHSQIGLLVEVYRADAPDPRISTEPATFQTEIQTSNEPLLITKLFWQAMEFNLSRRKCKGEKFCDQQRLVGSLD